MDIRELLGIDTEDPMNQLAYDLVVADEKLVTELINIRRDGHLSQQDVADRLGVSQSAVARIESGERDPRLSTLRRYALAVGASVHHEVKPCGVSAPSNRWAVPKRDIQWPSAAVFSARVVKR